MQATGDADGCSEDRFSAELLMLCFRSQVGDEVEQLGRDRPDSAEVRVVVDSLTD